NSTRFFDKLNRRPENGTPVFVVRAQLLICSKTVRSRGRMEEKGIHLRRNAELTQKNGKNALTSPARMLQ
ncbi:hypothetical protein, partial [Alistipes finegoldii]|uniref:hypothetical protein n=1 Tax=Alistipes finegoldii TaxID=214856 RepID=UPI003AB370EC